MVQLPFDDLDVVFAQHIMTSKPLGEIHIKSGAVTANSHQSELTINGQWRSCISAGKLSRSAAACITYCDTGPGYRIKNRRPA